MKKKCLRQSRASVDFDIAGKSLSGSETDRDYVDYLWEENDHYGPLGVVVGNISGHGEDAELLMVSAGAFFRVLASRDQSIDRIVTEMNQYFTLELQDNGWLISLLVLVVDPESRRIRWVRAGHEQVLLYNTANGVFQELEGNGSAIGADKTMRFHEHFIEIPPDGRLISVVTDGLWKRRDKNEPMFGENRFREIIREHAAGSAADILDAVFFELQRFSSGREPEEDTTLIVIKVNAVDPIQIGDWKFN